MSDDPLDEKVWSSLPEAQEMGGIHTNTILMYFSRSIFFDPTSNNAIVVSQAMYNPALRYIIETRHAFERHLRTMSGLEFMVTQDPSKGDTIQNHSGVWVIRKQRRQKRADQEDEITPLNSYFVIGLNIYMAPSMGNVLGNRMLNFSMSLTQSLQSVGKLAGFSASMAATAQRQAASNASSLRESKMQLASFRSEQRASKEATPVPGTPATATNVKPFQFGAMADEVDSALLGESLMLSGKYKDEYMDENPLFGEPGSFVMRKSRTDNTLVKPSQTAKIATPLPPIETNVENPMTKGSKDSAKTPITPGGSKKRKKSRVLSTATPK